MSGHILFSPSVVVSDSSILPVEIMQPKPFARLRGCRQGKGASASCRLHATGVHECSLIASTFRSYLHRSCRTREGNSLTSSANIFFFFLRMPQ